MVKNLAFAGIVIMILIVAGFIFVFREEKKGDTYLYFNEFESDLPDPAVYLMAKVSINASQDIVYPIYINKPYSVVFSISSDEKKRTSYVYGMISPILSKTEKITLDPKETKKITLTLSPKESQKWSTKTVSESVTNGSVDVTKDSWIAEKKDLRIFVGDDGLPLLVEENYHLPISSAVGEHGEILHTNLSLEDLKKTPFTKEYVKENKNSTYEFLSVDTLGLQIKDDKISSYVDKTIMIRESIPQTFIVYLKKSGETELDKATGREFYKEIHFNYRII